MEEVREKYDPLYSVIPPHITLVFPFESDISTLELKEHVHDSLREISPFTLRLQGVTGSGGEYLFLNVKQGNDEIIRIHDLLYTGILKEYYFREVSFIPHITIGRLQSKKDFRQALLQTSKFDSTFETKINSICCEVIANDDQSEPEFWFHFE
ncbi:2'-5' RNA ligase family protein [Bacillus seohaeanensis]|uniref:2'-5' RNA ligase family protein n=1 Tax=Bacillus seohaeanensis TaxID=284580 RepID=A0ABW5RNL1_9BACI